MIHMFSLIIVSDEPDDGSFIRLAQVCSSRCLHDGKTLAKEELLLRPLGAQPLEEKSQREPL